MIWSLKSHYLATYCYVSSLLWKICVSSITNSIPTTISHKYHYLPSVIEALNGMVNNLQMGVEIHDKLDEQH